MAKIVSKGFVEKIFEATIVKSWWVILFLLICYIGYDQGMKKRNKDIYALNLKYNNLLIEKGFIKSEAEDLNLKIHSQSDPAWIELVLMKELGVVPEGKIKVHFKN